ncbi:hypothetical protein AN958_10588 [Leucoagaricus sp. SymC.cos]|nr:hypothetical protein AN958_10588 [Leucoagaricus sp. SymC.cos]
MEKMLIHLFQGFFFDYDKGLNPRVPVTSQCERIHIQWARGIAIGENPTPPYYLQVFTSTADTPFIIPAGNGLEFDWDVPFAPGVRYQICMFDTNGVPGGCQEMYTMIQNQTVANPVCQNVTAPPQLDVDAKVEGGPTIQAGPFSRYGFPDQCTDLSFTPKSGTPPFILTVAPSLHPPYNITSDNMDPIVWTVSLSWASPFFISIESSNGEMWAAGPLHAGGFGPNDCLAPGSISRKRAAGIAAGASIGASIGCLLLGYASLEFFKKIQRKRLRHPEAGQFKEIDSRSDESSNGSSLERPLPEIPERLTSLREAGEWNPTRRPSRYNSIHSGYTLDSSVPPGRLHGHTRTRTVIVHHDGGRVRAEDVEELPPEYRRQSTGGSESSLQSERPEHSSSRKRSGTR